MSDDAIHRRRADELLRESEERFRLLVEGVLDYGIYMLDPRGYVTTWNAGAERISGYRAEEILGRHFSTFYPPESMARDWPAHELRVARREGRFEEEGWRLHKDGSRFWAGVVITALHDSEGRLRGFSKVTRNLTERRHAEEKLQAAHAALERRVEERTAELARANKALTREIGQREQLELELRELITELKQQDAHKNQFLTMLAHELRNPLAPMLAATACLRLGRFPDPAMQRAADIIDRQVGQMAHLVDDLVDLSRLTSDRLVLRKEWTNLSHLVDQAIEASRPAIDRKNHRLVVELPPDPPRLYADPMRVVQLLSNLLDNAAKFTPNGGSISLVAEQDGGAVTLRVRDNGIGLAADKLSHVFDIFAQVDRSWDQSSTGLGVGLALVKRLVELHGGTVEARSDGAQSGSEFVVRLPIAVEEANEVHDARSSPSSTPALPRRILVVDDNEDLAESLSIVLSSMGSDVRTAFSGVQAIATANEFRPDAVVLDIGLPELSGYDVARHIRQEPWGEQTLLIAMTGWGQAEDRQHTKEAGFDHHVVKPVDLATLRSVLSAPRGL